MESKRSSYRYPGVKPFETEESDLFFGRKRDINDLFDLIKIEKMVVLFAKSGYGKSSLINAGLIPRLLGSAKEDLQYVPLLVRFGAYSDKESSEDIRQSLTNRQHSPLNVLIQRIRSSAQLAVQLDGKRDFLIDLLGRKTLWYELKKRQNLSDPKRIVLIFDQFEEFFTYPLSEQQSFKNELSELLFEEMPKAVRDASQGLNRDSRLLLSESLDVKVLFAIRSDKVSLLDTMKSNFPAILHHRYPLRGLSTAQAEEAIEKPARIVQKHLETPPFEYSKEALRKILSELNSQSGLALANEENPEAAVVEAFQLQIICEHLESEVRAGKISGNTPVGAPLILPENLPKMSNLYEDYYRRKLGELDPDLCQIAQLILEEGLLAEDASTGEGRRMSVDSRALEAQFGLNNSSQNLLKALSNTFLIRPEQNSVGGVSYEISHDTLVAPIQKAKASRRFAEEKMAGLKRQLEAEERAQSEKKKRLEAERQRQKARYLAALAIVGSIIALAGMLWAFKAQNVAKEAQLQAEESLSRLKEAQQKDRLNELDKDVQIAIGQLSGKRSCLSDSLTAKLQRISMDFPTEEVRQKIDRVNQAIHINNPSCPLIKQ